MFYTHLDVSIPDISLYQHDPGTILIGVRKSGSILEIDNSFIVFLQL